MFISLSVGRAFMGISGCMSRYKYVAQKETRNGFPFCYILRGKLRLGETDRRAHWAMVSPKVSITYQAGELKHQPWWPREGQLCFMNKYMSADFIWLISVQPGSLREYRNHKALLWGPRSGRGQFVLWEPSAPALPLTHLTQADAPSPPLEDRASYRTPSCTSGHGVSV